MAFNFSPTSYNAKPLDFSDLANLPDQFWKGQAVWRENGLRDAMATDEAKAALASGDYAKLASIISPYNSELGIKTGLVGAENIERNRHNVAMENREIYHGRRPYVTQTPDEYGVSQPTIFNPEDGSLTPASPNKRFRPMTEGGVSKLTTEGGKLSMLRDYGASFQDSYAGMSAGLVDYGNAAKTVGQLGIGTQNASDAAQWWQGYDRYKNEVRKDLYGATLTPSEERTFEAADIRAGMDPALVRKNLAMQRTIIERAMKRKTAALIKSGFNPEVINEAYGIDAATLKDEAVASPGGANAAPDPGNESVYPEAGPRPSSNDMQMLKQHANNPQFRAEFEKLYGAGAVDRWLNNDGWTGR
jgi:hypothetical protein